MKKVIAFLLTAAMASTTVLAQEMAEKDIMLINEEETTLAQQMFVKSVVTGAELYEEHGIKYVKGIDEYENEIHFILTEDTVIVNEKGEKAEIEKDASFTAFVGWDTPAPLVLPPVYTPDAIVIDTEAELQADADVFTKTEETYVNAANTLALAVDPEKVVNKDGSNFEGDIDGKEVIAIYGITTRSIPPIAIPEKVIVLGDAGARPEEVLPAETATEAMVGDKKFEIVEKDGVDMLPVRAVSEALGLEVNWDSNFNAVTIGTVPMGVNFQIGTNVYNKARMTPFELEVAPIAEQTEAGGVTYVPVSFFTQVLNCTAEIADGVMTLTRA
ncbi:MAG: copper amine oxidase N-terminal domain-containing protein [Eubacteriales bacterium]|nr:copper amine oxidase N-terminal domain-containing protein [Eubacteriales bacterium]